MNGSKLIAEITGLSILSGDSQQNRLLRLNFPHHDAPIHALLLVNSIRAEEDPSLDFKFSVDLISDNALTASAGVKTIISGKCTVEFSNISYSMDSTAGTT